jgi:predicted transglutaminase-like cysteine proteinase
MATSSARSAEVSGPYTPSLFRSLELRFDDKSAFKKWVTMLERKLAQREELESRGCGFKPYEACGPYHWRLFLTEIQALTARAKIDRVNTYMNQFRYRTDFDNWGIADFWETPLEFLTRLGDCEDYAITKYVALKRLGFDPGQMRIVVLQDLNLGTGHAVLMVRLDGKTYILDNQIRQVTEENAIHHYRVVYSINENHWWSHIYVRAKTGS